MTLWMAPLVLIGAALTAAGVYLAVPFLFAFCKKRRLAESASERPAVFLTFDDGPEEPATRRILSILGARGVKATFFIIGENARRYPQIVAAMLREGHEVGWHGYHHRHPWKTGPVASIRELAGARRLLRDLGVPSCRLWRPAYGKLNLAAMMYALAAGWRMCFWTHDSRDYEDISAPELARRISGSLTTGTVLLLHDGRRKRYGGAAETTAKGLEIALDGIFGGGKPPDFRLFGELAAGKNG